MEAWSKFRKLIKDGHLEAEDVFRAMSFDVDEISEQVVPMSPDTAINIIKRSREGMDPTEIAKVLGVSAGEVETVLSQVPLHVITNNKPKVTCDVDRVREMTEVGVARKYIAKQLGVGEWTVSEVQKQLREKGAL